MTRISALIVNYNTSTLTRECVASLRAQQFPAAEGGATDLEIIVVDNASRPAERELLRDLDATVIYSNDNAGYGAALNKAYAQARGDFVLFSNPDTWYFPNALQMMMAAGASLPHCGAVGPRLWWDRAREFLLPPSDPVTLATHVYAVLSESWPRWRNNRASRWLRRAVTYWQCQKPLFQMMLSGACILTRRDVIAACGGFDERFRLYYEDTDWCRRIRQHGYQLYYVPEAEVAHLYNQSARQESAVAQRKFTESADLYFRKHYGAWCWKLASTLTTFVQARGQAQPHVDPYTQLGVVSEPPHFSCETTQPGPYLFLLSPVSSCTPAIARFSETSSLRIPLAVWQQLGEGTFYTRLVSLPSLQILGQWSWAKKEQRAGSKELRDCLGG